MSKRQIFLNFVHDKSKIKQILVLRNGLLGDTVFITSLLKRLNQAFPDASIDIIVGQSAGDVLNNFPGVRKIIPFKFDFSIFSILKQIIFFISLIPKRYSLLIIPEVNPHYTIVGKFCFPKKLASFTNPIGFSDYQINRPHKKALLADTELVKEWTEIDGNDKPQVFVTNEEKLKVKQFLKKFDVNDNDKILFFNPGSSKQYSEKDWPFENYAPVADHFNNKYGYKVVFNGLKRDKNDFDKIAAQIKGKAIMLAGEDAIDVRSMFALISISDLVFGVDTGPIHIATALDVPVLCLMGYMNPEDTGPYNPNIPVNILTSDMPCIPCVHANPKPAQWEEVCKFNKPVECMKRITPEKVIFELEKILNLKGH